MQARIVLVRILHAPADIWSHPDAAYRERELAAFKAEAEKQVDADAAAFSASSGVEVEGRAHVLGERWNIVAEILAAADDVDAELICMATHGEGNIRRLFVGSTSQEVIAQSARPVVLVKAGEEE
jgi:nucleotide-binding universal stress UspA family protein